MCNLSGRGHYALSNEDLRMGYEPSRTEAGKLVTGNLSLVIGHLEGDTARRRLRQSPITSDQSKRLARANAALSQYCVAVPESKIALDEDDAAAPAGAIESLRLRIPSALQLRD